MMLPTEKAFTQFNIFNRFAPKKQCLILIIIVNRCKPVKLTHVNSSLTNPINSRDCHSRFDALLALNGGSCNRSGKGRSTGSRYGPAGDKDQRALDHGRPLQTQGTAAGIHIRTGSDQGLPLLSFRGGSAVSQDNSLDLDGSIHREKKGQSLNSELK